MDVGVDRLRLTIIVHEKVLGRDTRVDGQAGDPDEGPARRSSAGQCHQLVAREPDSVERISRVEA